jgi:hypothetical protein
VQRGELEDLFFECVENVRREILRRRFKANSATKEVKLEQFLEADRRKVLELLASDERILQLVHSRIFPSDKPVLVGFSPSKKHGAHSQAKKMKTGESLISLSKGRRPSTALSNYMKKLED